MHTCYCMLPTCICSTSKIHAEKQPECIIKSTENDKTHIIIMKNTVLWLVTYNVHTKQLIMHCWVNNHSDGSHIGEQSQWRADLHYGCNHQGIAMVGHHTQNNFTQK